MPSASSETVTFSMNASEFTLLATFMAPLGLDESVGESVWVTGGADGTRRWIATSGKVTAVVDESGLDDSPLASSHIWAYPIAEQALILLGRLFATNDEVHLSISDDHIRLVTTHHDVVIPQIDRQRLPPSHPCSPSPIGVTVNASDLFTMLTTAALWPGGGTPPDHDPLITCTFDPDCRLLVLTPHWGHPTLGYASYRLSATPNFPPTKGTDNSAFTAFNLFHQAIIHSLRDPVHAARIGEITVHQPTIGTHQHCLTGAQWMIQLPIIADISPWGHDLDDVLGSTPHFWIDPQCVRLNPPELSPGGINLEAMAPGLPSSAQIYRLTSEILPIVAPSTALLQEINDFNRRSIGYLLLIDGARLIARRDLSRNDYADLGHQIDLFVKDVSGLSALFAAWAF